MPGNRILKSEKLIPLHRKNPVTHFVKTTLQMRHPIPAPLRNTNKKINLIAAQEKTDLSPKDASPQSFSQSEILQTPARFADKENDE